MIPLGSQTFSKSHTQYPQGASPHFLTHGRGGRVWDADGNEYIDLVCGLLPVVLGYCDPEVDQAIRDQLERGISFSLATELEVDLAERLVDIIPCAEMVRFGKNGTDATSAAIRLARAATGRDHVIACGYHGWQDWYVGATTRNRGVPDVVGALTHRAPFGDMEALHALFRVHPDQIAAIMMEPMNAAEPAAGYLGEVKELAHANGALFIFDEVVTGFRYAPGGAQEHFGITPDLASFGKAMGNGMPISAIVGRADLMTLMEEIFFSSTFGGETLSLAASITVIDKMQREPVIDTLWQTGRALATRAGDVIAVHGLENIIRTVGKPCWTILEISDHKGARKEAINTLFLREMLGHGVLLNGSHNICYAHSDADIDATMDAYDKALATVAAELDRGGLEDRLDCPVLMPVFAVRPTPGTEQSKQK